MRQRSVLICDDEISHGTALPETLAAAGFSVTIVADGYDAVERIDSDHPSAIIVDVMARTGLSGFGVLSHLEQNHPDDVPRTFIVSNMTEQSVLRFAPAFASRIFRKSADARVIVEAIRHAGDPRRDLADTVVIVDDDPATRELLAEYLSQHSYRTLQAADGRAALEVIGSGSPRRVLIDLMMPGIDGVSVLEHLGRTTPEVLDRTVIVTGLPQQAIEKLPALAVRGVVRKPIDFDELDKLL